MYGCSIYPLILSCQEYHRNGKKLFTTNLRSIVILIFLQRLSLVSERGTLPQKKETKSKSPMNTVNVDYALFFFLKQISAAEGIPLGRGAITYLFCLLSIYMDWLSR